MASFAYSFLLLLSSSHALQKDESTICAIGDLHGDANHALQAFQLCNVVDGDGRWSGGTATVIQTGDVLDRGNASLPLLYWLWSLREQAAAAGGDLVLMMGNHELLNMQGKTYYVDADELSGFGGKEAPRTLQRFETHKVAPSVAGRHGSNSIDCVLRARRRFYGRDEVDARVRHAR